MAQTFIRVLLHIIFSTKDRQPLIDPAIEPNLYAYIGGIAKHHGSPIIAINGTADHVHILLGFSKNISIAQLLMKMKRDSSVWMNARSDHLNRFHWQDGYAAFSIGESNIPAAVKYIANQKTHHLKTSFQDELLRFVKKYGLPYDERFIWK